MSASKPGPGRPPNPATQEKAREYLRQHTLYGTPIEKIAEVEDRAPSHVWDLVKKARAAEAAEQAAVGPSAAVGETQQRPQPKKMSRRTAHGRAWDFAERNAVVSLSLSACDFWVRLVIAIHENGDGFRLHLGEPGHRFQTRADLVMLRMAQVNPQDVDVAGWLAELFKRGRLIEIGGVDIGIPPGLGLTPGENARGKLIGSKPRPEAGAQPPLRFPFQVVQGSLSDSGKLPPSDSGETPNSPESDSGKPPSPTPVNYLNSPESLATTTTTTTTTNQLNSFDCCSGSRVSARAGDSGELGVSPESEGAIHRSPTPVNSPESADTALARKVGELCGYGKPDDADVAKVGEWLTYPGISEPLILGAVAEDRLRNPLPVHSLGLFTKAIKAALSIEKAKAAQKAAPPACPSSQHPPPRSEADLALDARLEALTRRRAEAPDGPGIPLREAFDAACRAWKPADALRWIAAVEGLLAAGLLADVDLPEFHDYVARPHRFEDQMIQAEEALTSPDTS
jgi:hypothetical protein